MRLVVSVILEPAPSTVTLPLPVDPETFRETYTGYAPFDQTSGVNPFNFFDPKIGVQMRLGSIAHGVSGDVDALQGHDRQSGLAWFEDRFCRHDIYETTSFVPSKSKRKRTSLSPACCIARRSFALSSE